MMYDDVRVKIIDFVVVLIALGFGSSLVVVIASKSSLSTSVDGFDVKM